METCQVMGCPFSNRLDFSQSTDAIWYTLRTAVNEQAKSGLQLGLILAQIHTEEPYERLQVKGFGQICFHLGLCERKARHLIAASEAWLDACKTLAVTLDPPRNRTLVANLFNVKIYLSEEQYLRCLKALWLKEGDVSGAISLVAATIKEHCAPTNTFLTDRKRILSIQENVARAIHENGFLRIIVSRVTASQEQKSDALMESLDTLIAEIESYLSENSSSHGDAESAVVPAGSQPLNVVSLKPSPGFSAKTVQLQ